GRAAARRHGLQVGFSLCFALIVLAVMYLVRGVLGAFVLGAVLAFLIVPAVDWMERRHVRRPIGVLLCFAVVGALAVALVQVLIPLLGSEVRQLQSQIPAMAATIQARLTHLGGRPIALWGFKVDLKAIAGSLEAHVNEVLLGSFSNALSFGIAAVTTILQIALLLIVAFLLAVDGHPITGVARRVVPARYEEDYERISAQIQEMLYAYIRGQLLVAALIGVVSGLAIAVLGLPYALALGVFAGLTALVPYLGPFLGAVPALVVAVSINPSKAALVAGAYFVISNVILNGVYPKIVGGAVRLPALLVIVALIAGFSLGGILGMFVAVPVAATVRILFEYVHPRVYGAPQAAAPR
ncbi:MAG: AI-2E family transporter, partial [Candidatus Dormibacterales bacterium]